MAVIQKFLDGYKRGGMFLLYIIILTWLLLRCSIVCFKISLSKPTMPQIAATSLYGRNHIYVLLCVRYVISYNITLLWNISTSTGVMPCFWKGTQILECFQRFFSRANVFLDFTRAGDAAFLLFCTGSCNWCCASRFCLPVDHPVDAALWAGSWSQSFCCGFAFCLLDHVGDATVWNRGLQSTPQLMLHFEILGCAGSRTWCLHLVTRLTLRFANVSPTWSESWCRVLVLHLVTQLLPRFECLSCTWSDSWCCVWQGVWQLVAQLMLGFWYLLLFLITWLVLHFGTLSCAWTHGCRLPVPVSFGKSEGLPLEMPGDCWRDRHPDMSAMSFWVRNIYTCFCVRKAPVATFYEMFCQFYGFGFLGCMYPWGRHNALVPPFFSRLYLRNILACTSTFFPYLLIYLLTYWLTHSFTHLLTYLLNYLLTDSLIHSLTHWLTYLPTYLLTYLPTYLLTYSPTYLLTYLPTYLLTYLLTYLPTYLLTYLPTYLLTYLPTYLLVYLLTYLLTYLLAFLLTYLLTYLLDVMTLYALTRGGWDLLDFLDVMTCTHWPEGAGSFRLPGCCDFVRTYQRGWDLLDVLDVMTLYALTRGGGIF